MQSVLKHWADLAEFGPNYHAIGSGTTTLQHSKVFHSFGAFQSVKYSISNLHQQKMALSKQLGCTYC